MPRWNIRATTKYLHVSESNLPINSKKETQQSYSKVFLRHKLGVLRLIKYPSASKVVFKVHRMPNLCVNLPYIVPCITNEMPLALTLTQCSTFISLLNISLIWNPQKSLLSLRKLLQAKKRRFFFLRLYSQNTADMAIFGLN